MHFLRILQCDNSSNLIPLLRSLPWFPVQSQIEQKSLVLASKALHVLVPPDCPALIPCNIPAPECSSNSTTLSCPKVSCSLKWPFPFSLPALDACNWHSKYQQDASSLTSLKSLLKGCFFHKPVATCLSSGFLKVWLTNNWWALSSALESSWIQTGAHQTSWASPGCRSSQKVTFSSVSLSHLGSWKLTWLLP